MPGLIKKEEFKDNCGFGLIANINGVKSHKVIINSINALISMTHRGGVGSDGKTGDGCGLLFDIDHKFFADTVLKEQNIEIGEHFAIGQIFYNQDIAKLLPKIKKILKSENLALAAYRKVPVDEKILGEIAHSCLPEIFQLFIKPTEKDFNQEVFETGLIQARKYIEEIYMDDEKLYVCSMSSKTVVYKGLMLPNAIKEFYLDLNQENFRASTCVFHQRFSTNTSPRWHLAQPFRLLAHNGEINAIRGNRNWVKARSSKFKTPLIPKIQKFKQLVNETGSDSSSLDNMIELLVKGGVDIFRAIRMVLPPAWQNIQTLDPDVRGFHEYNSMHMEPWDGPAGIVMSDGKWALCVLDRNGLRPARFQLDKDNIITIASETGVNPVNESDIVQKGRVAPGGMLAIDTSKGRIYDESAIDDELKQKYPYRKWLKENAIYIESRLDSYEGPGLKKFEASKFLQSSKLFLLFKEERTSVIKPLAVDSQEGYWFYG
jgi:glutamate synthase (NADPH/NADH) large chain